MKLNFKDVIVPALILCLICTVVTAVLALTNEATKDVIAEVAAQVEEESRKIVMPIGETFEQVDDSAYKAIASGGETVGFVIVTETQGYSGVIKVMTGIDIAGDITGVEILQQTETPGLGANADNPEFTDRFKQPATALEVVKSSPTEGQVQALTGSTITTQAVTDAVNEAVEIFNTLNGGGSNG